jgi:NADPH:quinone reductase-like Zn-dependent oxidoreductase
MKAITVKSSGSDGQVEAVLDIRPLPKLRFGYLFTKVMAVALNPSDVVLIDLKIAVPGSLTGADYAGVVTEVGPDVQRDFKPGDRVCGATRNGDSRQPENGVFAEYIVVKADIQLKIPSSMGFEQAASLGVTTLTTGRCFMSFSI